MRKSKLKEWAAISEIVASVGVIVSLLFLAYSVRENTVVTQSSNDNFLYELQFARVREITANPSVAALYTKLSKGEALTEIEETQLLWDNLQQIGTWEISYVRHRDGLYSDDRWEAWDKYYKAALLESFPKDQWDDVSDWYEDDFRSHVDAAYKEKLLQDRR